MSQIQAEFLRLLFNDGECTTYCAEPHGYRVSNAPKKGDLFLCVNALHPYEDLNPTKEWHSANLPRRADQNVVSYRTFLLEIDSMPLDEQLPYFIGLNIPYSAIVYSGGKSHHFLIVLEHPVASYADYMSISRRLHKVALKADPATKNPSRLSRLPDVMRPDTGQRQELVHLGHRVKLADLETVLPPALPPLKPRSEAAMRSYITPLLAQFTVEPEAVMQQLGIPGRNAAFFWAGNRMLDLNLPAERREALISTAYNSLRNKDGFTFEEACIAARVRGN